MTTRFILIAIAIMLMLNIMFMQSVVGEFKEQAETNAKNYEMWDLQKQYDDALLEHIENIRTGEYD